MNTFHIERMSRSRDNDETSIRLCGLALLDSLGMILGIEVLALLGLSVYVILAPIWALWLGIDLLRKPVQID